MDYVLQFPISSDDIDFLNVTSIEFEIFDPTGKYGENDSGWCDGTTGARLIMSTDRVAFKNVTPEDLLLLELKFHRRIKPLHNGFKHIYKYKLDIQ
jgi:hypothetical protein